jgi:SAM-dependent methyltransferase
MPPSAPLCVLRDAFHRNLDLPFYLRLAQAAAAPVLELGCGTGRVSRALAAAGVHVHCVERDAECAGVARRRAPTDGGRMTVVVEDVHAFHTGRSFGLVLGASFFEHLTDAAELAGVLARVRPWLAPGGRVAFRVATRSYPERSGPFEQSAVLPDGRAATRTFVTEPDPPTGLVRASFAYRLQGVDAQPRETMLIRRWSLSEAREVIRSAGYRAVAEHGDFSGAELAPESPFAVFVLAPDGGAGA